MCAVKRPRSRGQSIHSSKSSKLPRSRAGGTPCSEDALLRQWQPRIMCAARKAAVHLGGGEAHAKDLAQRACIGVMGAARKRTAPSASYLSRAMSFALRNGLRSERRGGGIWSPSACELDEAAEARASEIADNPRTEAEEAVALWVDSLPERLRELCNLLYRDGYTQREAAKRMHLSQPRVSQLHRDLLERGRRELAHLGT